MNKVIIGKRIRHQREKLSLTREQFAEHVGVSTNFVSEIELGKKGISAETLFKICSSCNISADYILLGRYSTEGTQSEIAELLQKIPARYTSSLEGILKAFLAAITIDKDES